MFVCSFVCLFQILNTGNTATSNTQREEMDMKKKEDVAPEYEVPLKMTECEAYATLSNKPWHPQEMRNGVVLVEFMLFVYMIH